MDPLFSFDEITLPVRVDPLQHIDEPIDRNQTQILTLRGEGSRIAPISRLPAELLCKIFMIVRKYVPKEPEYGRTFVVLVDGKVPNPLEWIVSLTHVNRHWRDVAINSPTLWTIIDDPLLYNIAWLEEVISRSKEALLTVEFNTTLSERSISGLKLVFEIGHRIQHLTFKVYPANWDAVKELLPKTAPELKSLSIAHIGSSPMDDVLLETPKLRHLTLGRFDVSFWSRPRASVSHLELQGSVLAMLHRDRNLTWQQFADVLKGMPSLQVLRIAHILPIHEEHTFFSSGAIDLPSLKLLHLVVGIADAKSAEKFLSQFSFPLTTSIMIGYYTEGMFELRDLFPDRLLGLARSLSNHVNSFRTLVLSESDLGHDGISLKLFEDTLTDEQMLTYRQILPRLELNLSWLSSSAYTSQHDERADILNRVFGSRIPLLLSIENVCLAGGLSEQSEPIDLAKTVGQLPQLHTIVVTSDDAPRLLVDALQLRKSEDLGNTAYFPNLSSVYLHGTLWDEEVHFRKGRKLVVERLSPFKLLYECLSQRRQAGVGIEKLTVKLWRYLTPPEDDVDLHYIDLLKQIILFDLRWENSSFRF